MRIKIKPGMSGKEMRKMCKPSPKKAYKRKTWTEAEDDAQDRRRGIKEGSPRDIKIDHSRGLVKKARKSRKARKSFTVKHSGTFHGKSNVLGHGGRAAQMRAHGVPGGVIGAIARSEGAAPGQANYHGGKAKKAKK